MKNKETKITKVIIPVAGMGTRFLPATKEISKEMIPILDRPIIDYAVDEAKKAGIEKFIFIISNRNNFPKLYFGKNKKLEKYLLDKSKESILKVIKDIYIPLKNITFIVQEEPLGLGHAILCARKYIESEPFAVILPDDLIHGSNCIKELINTYNKDRKSIIGLMKVSKKSISNYGIAKIGKKTGRNLEVLDLVEKPSLVDAPSNYAIVGRYVLESKIMSLLEKTKKGKGNEIQLTDALSKRAQNGLVGGYLFSGRRFDCGSMLGTLQAQVAISLSKKELKTEVLNIIKNEIKIASKI